MRRKGNWKTMRQRSRGSPTPLVVGPSSVGRPVCRVAVVAVAAVVVVVVTVSRVFFCFRDNETCISVASNARPVDPRRGTPRYRTKNNHVGL